MKKLNLHTIVKVLAIHGHVGEHIKVLDHVVEVVVVMGQEVVEVVMAVVAAVSSNFF